MSNSLFPGDIVVIISGGLRGQIGVVKGEGNIWDYTVTVAGEDYRLDPVQLYKISLAELISMATPVPEFLLAYLALSE